MSKTASIDQQKTGIIRSPHAEPATPKGTTRMTATARPAPASTKAKAENELSDFEVEMLTAWMQG